LDTLLALVAANRHAFPDLVWTVEQMAADGDTVAVRYTMTGTQQGSFGELDGRRGFQEGLGGQPRDRAHRERVFRRRSDDRFTMRSRRTESRS
jgi:hypothetical protein